MLCFVYFDHNGGSASTRCPRWPRSSTRTTSLHGFTNGPEETVASKTIRSVNMINQGLARLQSNIAKINQELTVNPEALLTVKTENLHVVSHFKHPTCMQLHYARDFGTTALESAKRTDAVVRFLLHTLNIVLSCSLDTNSPSRFFKDDATKPACHEFRWPRSDEKLVKHTR